MRGTTLIKIGDEERPLKFGTNQSAKYCEVRNVTLAQAQKELSSIAEMDVGIIRDLLFSALFAGYKSDKLDIDFDKYDVGNWMDDMEQDQLNKAFQTLVDSNDDGGEKGEVTEDEKK